MKYETNSQKDKKKRQSYHWDEGLNCAFLLLNTHQRQSNRHIWLDFCFIKQCNYMREETSILFYSNCKILESNIPIYPFLFKIFFKLFISLLDWMNSHDIVPTRLLALDVKYYLDLHIVYPLNYLYNWFCSRWNYKLMES